MLLSSLPITTAEEILRVIDYYSALWTIESCYCIEILAYISKY